jgi:methylmalonyl-CoA mutase cobalamin-binding domain/chain
MHYELSGGEGMSWLKAMMQKEPPEPENPIGIVVIGNLEGDRAHDTPRDMVRRALKRNGFKVVDLGKDVPASELVSKAKENNANIIAVSANTQPAKQNIPKLDEALKNADLKGKITVMIGGAAVKKADAEAIGAIFGKSKEEAVAIAKKAVA